MMKCIAIAVCLAAVETVAFGADAGNFVWNGGFEESYIYWANGIGNSNPYNLRTAEYGNVNTCQARLEYWTGTGGVTDKDAASSAPLPNDMSLYSGERCFSAIMGRDEPCANCPVAGLTKKTRVHTTESYYEKQKRWISTTASIVEEKDDSHVLLLQKIAGKLKRG